MHIYIATIGKNIEPVTKAVNAIPGIDIAYLIYSEKYAEDKDRACRALEALDIEVRCIESSGFDFQEISTAINRAHDETYQKGTRYSINITGGTNLMAAAACVAAFVLDAKVYYVENDPSKSVSEQVKDIPIPRVLDINKLTEKDRRILTFIEEKTRGDKKIANGEIASELDLDKQNVGYHLKGLQEKGLIIVEKGKGEDRRKNWVYVTREGRLVAKTIREHYRLVINYLLLY